MVGDADHGAEYIRFADYHAANSTTACPCKTARMQRLRTVL